MVDDIISPYDVYLVTLRVSRSHQDRKHVRLEKMIRSSAQQAPKGLQKHVKACPILDIP